MLILQSKSYMMEIDIIKDENPRLSASELADLASSSLGDFAKLDIGYHSEWNYDYFYIFFYHIQSDQIANLTQRWIISKWKADHKVFESFGNATNSELTKQLHDFEDNITRIRELVREKREEEKLMDDLEREMSSFGTITTTPSFELPSETGVTPYHMDDLPKDISNIVLLPDDKTYSCFVEDLRGPVKRWIDKHHMKDWNVVKFACMVHKIVARNTSVSAFAKLLKHIIPGIGDQEENMKKRKDANKERIDYYETNRDCWQLKNDVSAVDECLANTLELMSEYNKKKSA